VTFCTLFVSAKCDTLEKEVEKDTLKTREIKWSCVSRKCNAKLYTLGEGNDRIISRRQLDHNHEADVAKIQRQIVSVEAKRKATEDISTRPSKVCIICSIVNNIL
jgi:hypothetical protein